MRKFALLLVALTVGAALPGAQGRKTLDIYSIDVEGGGGTLFVSPSGESVLIDSGNPSNGRDADRIVAAARDAGLTQIDHLITTHFHGDHIGGLPDLADRFPIREFIDHGENSQPPTADPMLTTMRRYVELYTKARHTVVKAGDKLPVAGLDWLIVASNGEVIPKALPGAGKPNPECASFQKQEETNFEDFHSVGSLVTFGKFRFLLMGDFTVNYEFQLMCPNNRIGTVDAWLVSNHGQPRSGSAVLAHAIQPRIGHDRLQSLVDLRFLIADRHALCAQAHRNRHERARFEREGQSRGRRHARPQLVVDEPRQAQHRIAQPSRA